MSNPAKVVATWLPNPSRFAVEGILSACSYLALPWFNPREGGVRAFFEKNYREEPDASLYDGSSDGYFSKLKAVVDLQDIATMNIVDLGCGRGEFYRWLVGETGRDGFSYTGVDFAHDEVRIADGARIVRDDVKNISRYLSCGSPNFVLASNLMCYLSDEELSFVAGALHPHDMLVVIEPVPSLFWHAQFEGVKPQYRSLAIMEDLVQEAGHEIVGSANDYCINIGGMYLFPVSYCLVARMAHGSNR